MRHVAVLAFCRPNTTTTGTTNDTYQTYPHHHHHYHHYHHTTTTTTTTGTGTHTFPGTNLCDCLAQHCYSSSSCSVPRCTRRPFSRRLMILFRRCSRKSNFVLRPRKIRAKEPIKLGVGCKMEARCYSSWTGHACRGSSSLLHPRPAQ